MKYLQSLPLKAYLTLKAIKNLHTFALDFLGLINLPEIIYTTSLGAKFATRRGSSDKGEVVIINGDSEYPKKFFPSGQALTVLDIGAHIGSFSIYFSFVKRGNNFNVYSIEPSRSNYLMLKKNIQLNNLTTQIFPYNIAIGTYNGLGSISCEAAFDALIVNGPKEGLSIEGAFEECVVSTLESFANSVNITEIDLLKIDCEGAEHDIFKNSIEFIKDRIKFIFVEVHNISNNETVDSFRELLRESNFEIQAEILERTFFAKNLNLTS